MKKIVIVECPETNLNEQFEVDIPYDWHNR